MSDGELQLREARPDELPQILELMRASLGTGSIPRSEAFWRWKHEENPFGRSPTWVAVDGERIVGLRVFMRWQFHVDGREVSAVRAVDTATHPEYQGRGIFRRLTTALADALHQEGVAFIFNTPNEKSLPGYLKMGWQHVARVPLWIKPLRPIRAGVRRLLKSETPAVSQPTGSRALTTFLESELAIRIEKATGITRVLHTPRTREFLNWRYAAIPGFQYEACFAEKGDSGAVVFYRRRVRGDLLEGTILDVLHTGGAAGCKVAVRLLRRLARNLDVDYLVGSASRRSLDGVLYGAAGFLPVGRRGPWLVARPLCGAGIDLKDPGRWRWAAGDLELF